MPTLDTQLIGPSLAFGADVLNAERLLLSAALWAPAELAQHAQEIGLTRHDFVDEMHGTIFEGLIRVTDWLCGWTLADGTDDPAAGRVAVDQDAVYRLFPSVRSETWAGIVGLELSSAGVPNYSMIVKRYADLRDEAAEHLRRVAEIVGDNMRAKSYRILEEHRQRRLRRRVTVEASRYGGSDVTV